MSEFFTQISVTQALRVLGVCSLALGLWLMPAGQGQAAFAQSLFWTTPLVKDGQHLVQAGCRAAANRVASRTGGRVVRARAEQRGGQVMCVVVVLVPNSNPSLPPTTKTFVVPAN